ncbi:hypothetical protein LSUE1_G007924 [Lachnellula suecica]|uniref:N-acetyltransferase domain-containing protein n=1 Tax=Lachnellula suecica TaxID=602035 RepID=A0A8T9C0A7_9HELO|nr:hypothetical protein LSUE1_G007924 [Lachnellula suecica]
MVLKLQDIDPERDFPALARCLFESHETPPQGFFHVFFPINGEGDRAREDAIAEAAMRLKLWYTQDPTSKWLKVVDTETGRIAGAAIWKIHTENPFANRTHEEVTWFTDDGSRAFVEKAFELHSVPRARAAQRAHLYYRRQGVGQQCLDWGMNKADELGYEIFLESTFYWRPLYKTNGFIHIQEFVIHPETAVPDDKWMEIEEKVGVWRAWLMWRPVGGNYEEGKTLKPWEEA